MIKFVTFPPVNVADAPMDIKPNVVTAVKDDAVIFADAPKVNDAKVATFRSKSDIPVVPFITNAHDVAVIAPLVAAVEKIELAPFIVIDVP